MAFSATTAATEGFRLIGGKPGAILVWVLVTAAYLALFGGGFVWFFADDFAALAAMGKVEDSQVLPLLARFGVMAGIGGLLYLLGAIVLYTAIMRAALGRGNSAFGYLRLGMDEVRLGLTALGITVAFYAALAAVTVAIVAISVSDLDLGLKVGSGVLIGVAAFCLTIWVAIRICLLWPMIVAEGRVDLAGAWRLTRGRFWPILGMMLLLIVIAVVAQIIWETVFRVGILLAGGEAFGWEGLPHLPDTGPAVVAVIVALGIGLVVFLVLYTVLMTAPYARAYRDLVAEREETATA